jgi:hypothetical protein
MQRSASVHTDAQHARQPALLRLRRGSSPLPLWAFGRNDRDQVITVGSDPSCDWPISSAGIAPIEVAFLFTGDALFVQSARPNEGARLDGQRLGDGWVALHSGARLDLGTACIDTFLSLGSQPPARPRAVRTPAQVPSREEPTIVVDMPGAYVAPDVDPMSQTQSYGHFEAEPRSEVVVAPASSTSARTQRHGSLEPVVSPRSRPRSAAVRRGRSAHRHAHAAHSPRPVARAAHVRPAPVQAAAMPAYIDAIDAELDEPIELPQARERHEELPPEPAPMVRAEPARIPESAKVTAPMQQESDVWSFAGTEQVQAVMPAEPKSTPDAPPRRWGRHALYALGISVAYALWIVVLDQL